MTEPDRTALLVVLALVLGAVAVAFIGARPAKALPNCECGHDARAHEHNRPGTWCAQCPRFGEHACLHYSPTRRPSWADDPPPLPGERVDGEDVATEFLRRMCEPTRPPSMTYPWKPVPAS